MSNFKMKPIKPLRVPASPASSLNLNDHRGNRGEGTSHPQSIVDGSAPDPVTRLPQQRKRHSDGTLTQGLSGAGGDIGGTADWNKPPVNDPRIPKTIRRKVIGAANPKAQGKTVGDFKGAINND